MKFQEGDRVLFYGHIYVVTGAPFITGSFVGSADFEVVPVKLVSPDGDPSICAIKTADLKPHQVPWEKEDAGSSWIPHFLPTWDRQYQREWSFNLFCSIDGRELA